MSEDELQDKLSRLLETTKFLIVLDDMWKEEDWDRIKDVFPSKKEWKIVLTSRNKRVALRADPTCVTIIPECLSPEDSWTLFRRITFPVNDRIEYKVNEEMEKMGKQMITQCGRLPLAIKVLGGLLVSRHTVSEWKRVCENIGSHMAGRTSSGDENCNSVHHLLSLSFEDLPVSLKHCFLYLAHFPEDYPIRMDQLASYWAAEGITIPEYNERTSIRNVADVYMEELVSRNMVISERDMLTLRFETCHLHDLMRDFCLRKAKEENFLHVVPGTSTADSESLCKSRRFAIHFPVETFDVEEEMKNSKLRSLMIFNMNIYIESWMALDLLFRKLQLLRVLDLSFTLFEKEKLPSSIGELIHLRYLSFYGAKLSYLPSSMQNLKKLLYLNLSVAWGCPVFIPNNFMKDMCDLAFRCRV